MIFSFLVNLNKFYFRNTNFFNKKQKRIFLPNKHRFLLMACLMLVVLWLPTARGACLFNQYLDTTCKYCYTLFPGWNTWDMTAWNSCSEGMYFVVDQKLWVESWANVIIPSTSSDQSRYYKDDFTRQWIKCGADWANWIDNFGCTSLMKDSSSSDATSYMATTTNSKQQSALWSNKFTSWKMWTSSAWTSCSAKLLSSGACSTAWTDTNWRYWNANNAVWTLCANGYVLSSGSWVAKTCTVTNCNDCTSSSATTCAQCKEGYLNGGTTCTAWVSNCLQWSSATTWDLWKPGYILASDGNSWVSACSSGQFIQVTKLASPYGDAVDNRRWVAWDSSCSTWINTNAASSCTSWSLGKFLTVSDSTQITGTCTTKAAYSSTSDIVIYVSNLDTDYAKASSSILGTQTNPDIDLMTAIERAKQMVAAYTTKSDGSTLRVNIVLYKGDHYLLRKNIVPFLNQIDNLYSNYEIKITPMYWTTFPTDTAHWYTTGTDQVNIYNKLGPELSFTIPKILTIENINFQLVEGFIPPENDPDSCLTTRKKCCQWSSSTSALAVVTTGQTETWALRLTLSESWHRAPKYNMMNFTPYSAKYGLSAPPQLVLTSVTFADVFYEMNSLVDFNVGGYVTATGSSFLRFSNWGSVFKNSNPSMINLNTNEYYIGYVNNFNLRKNTVTSEYSCTGTTEWFNLKVSTSTFSTFNYLKTPASFGSFTNADNGMQNHAYVVQLESFNGQVVFTGNTFTDIVSVVYSCAIRCYQSFFGNPEQISIYGTEDALVNNYLMYLPSHQRDFQVSSSCTTFRSLVIQSRLVQRHQAWLTSVFYLNFFILYILRWYKLSLGIT